MNKRKPEPDKPEVLDPTTWVQKDSKDWAPMVERCFKERGYRPKAASSKWAKADEDGSWFPTSWIDELHYRQLPS